MLFYIYNNAHSAYVIVSGDDRMKPVLGYSDNGSFITENLPVNILSWLEYYNAAYENIKNGKKVFAEPKLLIRKSFPASISPLLGEINWNQDAPYNNACPMIQGQRSVTGCVATAMAMILKYYEYPAKGTGHYSYTPMVSNILLITEILPLTGIICFRNILEPILPNRLTLSHN